MNDPREEKADWAECWTLINRDHTTSCSEIRSILERGGSIDASEAIGEEDSDEYKDEGTVGIRPNYVDPYEAEIEALFYEITDRNDSCGNSFYPFAVTPERLELRSELSTSVYVFLLLVSEYGIGVGPDKGEGANLFEEICAYALLNFLGGKENLADVHVFGFPRRVSCDGFEAALESLCKRIGEGEGNKRRPDSANAKDAKLDVVGWKSFRDQKKGRLIVFGQCATGKDWKDKRSELIPTEAWTRYYMKDPPAVLPMRAFFVPRRIGDIDWFHTNVAGGLLFDRCRIASQTDGLPGDIMDRVRRWSEATLRKVRVS